MINSLGTLTWIVFALLGASLTLSVLNWSTGRFQTERLALVLFLSSFVVGIYEGLVSPIAAIPILFMVLCAQLYASPGRSRWFGLTGIVINAILVFTHKYPGFHNPVAINELLVSQDAIPYTRYLNFDKAAFAWSILVFGGVNKPRPRQLGGGLARLLPILVLAPTTLLFFAYVLGYAHWDPKLGSYLWIWIPTNLLFTCVAEELVFRELFLSRPRALGAVLALATVSSILFGIVHFPGGLKYILLATVAGGFYAWAYLRTNRFIVFSILTHFWVNLLHVLFFTYPALASAVPS